MKVKRNTLLLLACLVWTAAGVNILRIGLMAYAPSGVAACGPLLPGDSPVSQRVPSMQVAIVRGGCPCLLHPLKICMCW